MLDDEPSDLSAHRTRSNRRRGEEPMPEYATGGVTPPAESIWAHLTVSEIIARSGCVIHTDREEPK